MADHSYTYEDGDGRIIGTGTCSNATIAAAMENAGLLIADEVGSPEWREPRTAVEFRQRGMQMIEQAAHLPRHGCTMMSMSLREGAMEMLAQAERIEAEERHLDELRRTKVWEIEKRSAGPYDLPIGLRPPVRGGPNRKARRAERAKERRT